MPAFPSGALGPNRRENGCFRARGGRSEQGRLAGKRGECPAQPAGLRWRDRLLRPRSGAERGLEATGRRFTSVTPTEGKADKDRAQERRPTGEVRFGHGLHRTFSGDQAGKERSYGTVTPTSRCGPDRRPCYADARLAIATLVIRRLGVRSVDDPGEAPRQVVAGRHVDDERVGGVKAAELPGIPTVRDAARRSVADSPPTADQKP